MWLSRNKALAIALILVGLAFGWRFYNTQQAPQAFDSIGKPILGAPGSEHSHISMMIVVGDQPIDLYQPEYLDKSDYAHFHPDDIGGYFIHKHARGVTLSYFLNTLGIRLSADCLMLDTKKEYCSGPSGSLSLYINRKPHENDINFYELRDGDKILIDYGTSTPVELMLKANGIPDIPADLSQKG